MFDKYLLLFVFSKDIILLSFTHPILPLSIKYGFLVFAIIFVIVPFVISGFNSLLLVLYIYTPSIFTISPVLYFSSILGCSIDDGSSLFKNSSGLIL